MSCFHTYYLTKEGHDFTGQDTAQRFKRTNLKPSCMHNTRVHHERERRVFLQRNDKQVLSIKDVV